MERHISLSKKNGNGKKHSEIELISKIAELLPAKRRRELLDFAQFLTEAEEDKYLAQMIAEVSNDKVYSRGEALKIYAEMKRK